jgi:hypothetical protein
MRFIVAWALVLACVPAAVADFVTPTKMTLHPTALPAPVLRYRLLPDLREQKAGNAATHYKQAMELFKKKKPEGAEAVGEFADRIDRWVARTRLEDLPRDEVHTFLKPLEEVLKEIEAGAHCQKCDWEMTERLREKGIGALLPEIQDQRELAGLLALRARLEVADGKPEKALGTIRSGLAMAKHTGDSPTLISALVGIAIGTRMLERLEEVIQQPGAPNLYWALTDLRQPFIDMREGLEGERIGILGTFPGIEESAVDLNAGPLPAEKIPTIVKAFGIAIDRPLDYKERIAVSLLIARRHDKAKEALIAYGRPRDKVEAMPHVQVALLHAIMEYDELMDELTKWQSFPYWQAREGVQQAEQKVRQSRVRAGNPLLNEGPALPLAPLLLPAVIRVLEARVRLERRFAALRCVEAVRLYAHTHGGKLPETLEAIKDVPLPLDPVTGKPFAYKVEGETATLHGPPPGKDEPNKNNTVLYELTLKRP